MTADSIVFTESQLRVLHSAFDGANKNEDGSINSTDVSDITSKIMGRPLTARELKGIVSVTENMEDMDFEEFQVMMSHHFFNTLTWGTMCTSLDGYVGFDEMSTQMQRQIMKRGFTFNLLVVGSSGLGKTTMVNTLFASKNIARKRENLGVTKTVSVNRVCHVVEENGVSLRLSIVDTPGFGDQVDNHNCWEPIETYINQQYSDYFDNETAIIRRKLSCDTRIHCCLFFISPSGHSLHSLDIASLKRLQGLVNIIPVIAKADSFTVSELAAFKKRIREDIEAHDISLFPYEDDDDDAEETSLKKSLHSSLPFAIVGSTDSIEVGDKKIIGRKTPWGIVDVENVDHCEFIPLRDVIIRTHMHDLVDATHTIHYEKFRMERMECLKKSELLNSGVERSV